MSEVALAAVLGCRRGLVDAPAGTGKTELIANGVLARPEGRALVLTHTHAGVHAVRQRLRKKRVPPARYHVDTLSGFALRYASAFPQTSGLTVMKPTEGVHFKELQAAGLLVFGSRAVRRTLQASFTDIWVDEYQDCTKQQHELVTMLADVLPCRVLGDPLQGIFEFAGDLADWKSDVLASFPLVAELEKPHRWATTNAGLGAWLSMARRALLEQSRLTVDGEAPVTWIQKSPASQRLALLNALRVDGNVVALRRIAAACHRHARGMGGRYQSMEELESRLLRDTCRRLDGADSLVRAQAVVAFICECWTEVKTAFGTLRAHLKRGRPAATCAQRKHRTFVEAIVAVEHECSTAALERAVELVQSEVSSAKLFRQELWDDFRQVLRLVVEGRATTYADGAWQVRNASRFSGRRVFRRSLSRPFLVKGLEFDHVVILDADELSVRELYVALTRGSASLTVLSSSQTIVPRRW